MKKRGQFTIFIVLGLVILIVFSLMLYMFGRLKAAQLDMQLTKQVEDYISQNAINQYVTSCLDVVTDEAIMRASMQGGTFDFTGQTEGSDYIEYKSTEYNRTFNVSVVIDANTPCSMVVQPSPQYPYPDTHIYPPEILKTIYASSTNPQTCMFNGIMLPVSGFFGINRLTKLCAWNGTNKINATETYGYKSCESGTYNVQGMHSIQQDMELFIQDEMKKCVDFTSIENVTPANITIIDSPKATVSFSQAGMNVRLTYPFSVVMQKRQPIVKMMDFAIDKNVRFKELYDYAFQLVKADVSDVTFDMARNKQRQDIALYYNNYGLLKISNVDGAYHDIVIVTDSRSIIEGHPFSFQFAIHNRKPALDYIHEGASNLYDKITVENSTLYLSPQGYDPDEDSLTYGYNGWKEDYDEVFNDTTQCRTASLEYIIANCTIRLPVAPHNWTRSALFNMTAQNASYDTGSADVGFHVVNISVWDRQVLKDWQAVRILISDIPVARITGSNPYSDVADGYASFEDPYVLNGSNSTVGMSAQLGGNAFSQFVWNDTEFIDKMKNILMTDPNSTLLFIPYDLNGSYSIMGIMPLVFSNNSGAGKVHNISLRVVTKNPMPTEAAYLALNVTECLDHRNPGHPAFPYNNTDAFQSDHTCCSSSKTYETSATACFNESRYGGSSSFYRYNESIVPFPTYTMVYINAGAPAKPYDNDIYNQSFIRSCSGTRGNVCSGSGQETRTVIAACNDTNYNPSAAVRPQFQDERCSGPPVNTNRQFYSSQNILTCQNYDAGQSFELYAHQLSSTGKPADGICTTSPQCASKRASGSMVFDAYSGLQGPYQCNGACSNGACNLPQSCVCNKNQCSTPSSNAICNGIQSSSGPRSPLSGPVCIDNKDYVCVDGCEFKANVTGGGEICSNHGTNCNAYSGCNGRHPREGLTENKYCTDNCGLGSCYAYKYNTATSACYTYCTDSSQCSGSNVCITDPANSNYHQCVAPSS